MFARMFHLLYAGRFGSAGLCLNGYPGRILGREEFDLTTAGYISQAGKPTSINRDAMQAYIIGMVYPQRHKIDPTGILVHHDHFENTEFSLGQPVDQCAIHFVQV